MWVSTLGPQFGSTLLPTAWKCRETTENTQRENNIKRYLSSELGWTEETQFLQSAKEKAQGRQDHRI